MDKVQSYIYSNLLYKDNGSGVLFDQDDKKLKKIGEKLMDLWHEDEIKRTAIRNRDVNRLNYWRSLFNEARYLYERATGVKMKMLEAPHDDFSYRGDDAELKA